MKLFWSLAGVACLGIALTAATIEQLKEVSNVYILSMAGGMDQYLANQLAIAGVFHVVTDPKKADAILTDHVGEGFEKKLDELYPPPPTAEQLKKQDDADKDRRPGFDMRGASVGRPVSSFSAAKGNYFLVDRKSRAVLWSAYEPPAKDSTPRAMTKVAARVVKHLEADTAGKKPGVE